ncbi:quinone oxidoreductase-like protein 2 isoform X1 [Mytilus galloprovincialis]|uniref:quinone oxidoreductase-like protein 2 isoform X1 n=2 Tax=Mytilus galloprovincialis TaxID=29158 RepID=UPI003F7B66D2
MSVALDFRYLIPRRRKMLDNERLLNDVGVSPFECGSTSMPPIPKGGLLVRVACAGACFAEGQVKKRDIRPQLPGLEIAGYVQDVCSSLPNKNFTQGDKVILYPDEGVLSTGCAEYIAVSDVSNCIQIPPSIPLEVAAQLSGSALTAYCALIKAKSHVEKLREVKSCVNVMIIGAGGLGLWAVRIAQALVGPTDNGVRVYVADHSIDRLLAAQDHGCYDIIHWNEEDHEQYIVERTLDACRGGVDVIVDFVSSPRTVQRDLKVLNREGLILVGGNTLSEVSINLNVLAAKQQSIAGIPQGTFEQLQQIIDMVADNKVEPPMYHVFPACDAQQVYQDLAQCRIVGRAILSYMDSTQTLDNQH